MKKIGQIILVIMFLIIIFAIPVATKLQKNEAISKFENRRLAEAPVFTIDSLFKGEYFSKWETYLADHIYGRNNWISSFTYMNMNVLRRSNINNIVIGKDGFLLPFFSYNGKHDAMNNKDNLDKMALQLKELQDYISRGGGSFYFIGVPSQASYHRNDYPSRLQNNTVLMDTTEKFMFDNLEKQEVSYINMNKIFRQQEGKEFYYKTDHHYNFEGAYLTYYEIIKKARENGRFNIQPPLEKSEMDIVTLTNPFGGSRNRQIYYMYPTEEHIQIAYPKVKISYEKFTNGKADNKLYYLTEDKKTMINYGVYMGGDWAETVIKTHNDRLPNALIFGDSFTNAIEPLLYYHFNETRILDLRHYNKMSLYEYIDKYKPDIVVMVRDDLNYGNLEGNGGFKGENIKK